MRIIILALLLLSIMPAWAQDYDKTIHNDLSDSLNAAIERYKATPDEATAQDFEASFGAYFTYFDRSTLPEIQINKGKAYYRIAKAFGNDQLLHPLERSRIQLYQLSIQTLSPYRSDTKAARELGKAYYTLGTLYNMQRDGRRALAVLQAADTIFQRAYAPDHIFVGFTANAMASSYEFFGNYGAATVQYLRAIDINQRNQNRSSVGRAYNNLGTLYHKQNLLDKADTAFTKALQVYDLLRTDEQMEEGKVSARLLLSIAKAQFNLGELRRKKGELQAAYDVQLELLQLFRDRPDLEELDNTTHPDVHHALSSIYYDMGEIDSAFYHVDRAISIYQKTPAFGRRLADIYLSKSAYLEAEGQFASALQHSHIALQQATDLPAPNIKAGTPLTLPSLEVAQGNPVVLRILSAMARLYLKAYNSPQEAIQIGEYLISLSDKMRRDLTYEDQIILASDLKEGFDAAVVSAYQRYQQQPTDPHFDQLLQFSERKKAIALNTILNQVAATQNGGLPTALRQREARIREQLHEYRGYIQAAEAAPDDLTNSNWIDSIRILEAEYLQFTQLLERNYPKYYDLKYQSPTVHLRDLLAQCPADAAVLSYSLVSDALYILGLSPKGHFAQRVAVTADQLAANITAFHNLSQNNALIQATPKKDFVQRSHQLHQWLIAPVADQLADAKHLHIVPEAALFYLPFESLTSSPSQFDFRRMPLLLRSYSCTYHYSASQSLQPLAAPQPGSGLLAIAPVEHNDLSIMRNDRGNLPFAEKEVQYIDQQYRQHNMPSQMLLKSEATKANFLQLATSKPYQVIHLSTHSRAAPKAPDRSTLFFHEQDPDYRLFARELFNLNIRTDLLVMSSCESGIGNLAEGEGMISLNRGFLYAGAQNILFSIWQVNDQYTMQLMQSFHDNVLDGMAYPDALRSAKLSLIDSGQMAALPLYWSGFLLLGN